MFAINQIGINLLGFWDLGYYLDVASAGIAHYFAELINKLAQFAYNIASLFMMLIDFVQELFRKLAGLDPIQTGDGGQGEDLIFLLFRNEQIMDAFASLIIVGILLLFLFTIIQFIRIEYTAEGAKNSRGNIVGQALRSLVMFLIVPIACAGGIVLSNQVLYLIDSATGSGASTISGQLFKISAYNANPIRAGESSIVWAGASLGGHSGSGAFQRLDFFGEIEGWEYKVNLCIRDQTKAYAVHSDSYHMISGLAKAPIISTDNGYTFAEGRVNFVGLTGSDAELFEFNTLSILPNLDSNQYSHLNEGDANSGEMLAERLDIIFAQPESKAMADNGSLFYRTQINAGDNLNYSNHRAVFYFYNIGDINYFLLYVAGWFALKSLLFAVFGLIMRLYMITILFVISPPVIAMAPIDNGKAFNQWRGKFIGQVISAYGIIVGLNLFFKVASVISNVNLFNESFDIDEGRTWAHITAGFYNSLFQLLAVLVGCLMIKNISAVISQIIGAEDSLASGTQMSKEVGSAVTSAAQRTGKVAGMLASGGSFVVGKGMSLSARMQLGNRAKRGAAEIETAKESESFNKQRLQGAQQEYSSAKAAYKGSLDDATHKIWGDDRSYDELDDGERASVDAYLEQDGTSASQVAAQTARLRASEANLASADESYAGARQATAEAISRRDASLADAKLQSRYTRGEILASRGGNVANAHLKNMKPIKAFNDYTGNMFTGQATKGLIGEFGGRGDLHAEMAQAHQKALKKEREEKYEGGTDKRGNKKKGRMRSVADSVRALNNIDVAKQMATQYRSNIETIGSVQRGELNIAQDSILSLAEVLTRAQERINNAGGNDALRNRAEEDKYKALGDMQGIMDGLIKSGIMSQGSQSSLSDKLQALEGGGITIDQFKADLQSENFFETRVDAIMKNPQADEEMKRLQEAAKRDNQKAIEDAIEKLESRFMNGNIRLQSVEDVKKAVIQSMADQKSQTELLKKLSEFMKKQ